MAVKMGSCSFSCAATYLASPLAPRRDSQSSYTAFPSRPIPCIKGVKLKKHVTSCQIVGKPERCFALKCSRCLGVGSPIVRRWRVKPLRISAFKGGVQNDESGGRANGSKVAKNGVKVSYIPNENEETMTDTPKASNFPLSYASEANETVAGSAVHKLFKKWLTMLRTQSSQAVDNISDEGSSSSEVLETSSRRQSLQRGEVLKAVWNHFWGLDATIKIPLLIFVPWYLGVNVVYGAEVSRELTPMWVLGPLVVALHIKMLRGLCALYVFCFKQTVEIVKNLPMYYLLVYNYLARGKLKEDIRALVWQPVVDIKNLDYKELSRKRLKELEEWVVEMYLDFVESIWPYYCRTIRFLKRANLL